MAWTKEQEEAINLEGGNIIVSAGAGSGKTAVLTARVQRKLLSGIHVNELLVLTFTNAAAKEMKDRIRKTIRETPGLEKEANLVDGAYITTFDSFSLSLVKKYHTELNITNNIQITDEVFIEQKKNEILDQIMDEYYWKPTPSFQKLIEDFCLKDDEELKNYLLNIYQKIELKYNKSEYLNHYFENELTKEKIDSYVLKYEELLKEKQSMIKEMIIDLGEYFDGDFITKVEDNFKTLLEANTYNEFIKGIDFKSITVPRGSSEEGKKLKARIFEKAKEIKELCIYENKEEIINEIESTRESVEVIISILQELDRRLTDYKMDNYIYNFTDISRMAIKLVMENKNIREELQNTFQEILLDEYQDTSDLQELFISLISKNNVYMVGDIKQSIYRFRNANPTIFKEKYNTYRDTSKGTKIDLLKNFRSRKEVLEDINLLFNCFMDEKLGGAAYQESHQMNFGNMMYIEEGKTTQNYHFEVLSYDSNSLGKLTKDEEEAFLIGNDIQEKIKNHVLIFDKDKKVLREIKYNDIVILLDKSKNFDLYKKIFEYLHIPLSILKEESLKKDEDILVIKNLFKLLICIKENRFDTEFKYAYTSISRSFLYKTSDKEIYSTFSSNSFKETPLFQTCISLIDKIDEMPLSSYFNYVLDEFKYEEKLVNIGNMKSFRIRREYLYNLCSDYENMGKSIYDFVLFINDLFEKDYDLKFNVSTDSSNSCRIMTIHKSKGLEFPICYFAGFSSKFNINELKERIIYDSEYGIILPKVEESYKDTILKILLKNKVKQEEISEKIRLLYVAVTRAKEKMIFVLPKMEEEEEFKDFVPDYTREKYQSFLTIMKSIYTVLLPYIKECEIIGSKDYLNYSGNVSLDFEDNATFEVKEIQIDEELVEEKHYSKERLEIASNDELELMKFGTKMHEVLEELDFNNINFTNFDIPSNMKNKIMSFLNSNLIKNKLNGKIYKEYEFVYETEEEFLHGIIDLMIEEEKEITIIDYKLKNIDDSSYDKQLNGYRDYIMSLTNKEVKCYLYSLLDEEYREVKYM